MTKVYRGQICTLFAFIEKYLQNFVRIPVYNVNALWRISSIKIPYLSSINPKLVSVLRHHVDVPKCSSYNLFDNGNNSAHQPEISTLASNIFRRIENSGCYSKKKKNQWSSSISL